MYSGGHSIGNSNFVFKIVLFPKYIHFFITKWYFQPQNGWFYEPIGEIRKSENQLRNELQKLQTNPNSFWKYTYSF